MRRLPHAHFTKVVYCTNCPLSRCIECEEVCKCGCNRFTPSHGGRPDEIWVAEDGIIHPEVDTPRLDVATDGYERLQRFNRGDATIRPNPTIDQHSVEAIRRVNRNDLIPDTRQWVRTDRMTGESTRDWVDRDEIITAGSDQPMERTGYFGVIGDSEPGERLNFTAGANTAPALSSPDTLLTPDTIDRLTRAMTTENEGRRHRDDANTF